ncbi:GIY-YIG nuclease family protein [Dolichospermum sp. ST_con]|nr:GIY-YIG nuclease family protein [Dolichospermum sp. ST_con]MDD1419046.1 GIY-YIG nuclease family protein [Dolichospermum sp. ST_sed1]MDD1424584.1 GIY-YIG nuclease family protein [Dolichospermum sp. ST_sed9]MDD1433823.1 GIY-YIG nuclease family protein [Dolichospermum sp. ST_sed6]MDD1436495.1 GIY-YIG nuclease family protein [Dolichospermum sp. ST_sed10]MDD1443165.1 GIY-YIG nuclease family protein [Dolichospermum sp. ST_sed3]MDD1448815.1 GIY-YIG nuclease family protein [Dolichospermum sp. ST_s
MSAKESDLKIQAQVILDAIAFTPFEQCQPLNRRFDNITRSPGIYAIRHKTEGLLYIGKAQNLRSRFSGGHKAFLWAWLDKYRDEDVRIAVQPISHWENPGLLLELEAIILRATEPPYNVQIPSEQ